MYKNRYFARLEVVSEDELENIHYNDIFRRYIRLKDLDRSIIFYKLFGFLEKERDITFFNELERLIDAQERRSKNGE